MLYTINYYLRIIQASLDSTFGLFLSSLYLIFWLLSLPQMQPNSRGSFMYTSPGLEIHGRLVLWPAFAWCRYPRQPQHILIRHWFHCNELNSCELSHSQAYCKLILKAPPVLKDRPLQLANMSKALGLKPTIVPKANDLTLKPALTPGLYCFHVLM